MLNKLRSYFRRRSLAVEHTALRRVIEAEFDVDFYLGRQKDVAAAGVDPIDHYIEFGAREGRDPAPHFSTSYYLKTNPDVRDAGLNPFRHYIEFGRAEGRAPGKMRPGDPPFDELCAVLGRKPLLVYEDVFARRVDLRNRLETGALGDMVARAGALEPLIHHPPHEGLEPTIPPFNPRIHDSLSAIVALQDAVGRRRYRHVVVAPHVRMSGAARVAGELATALAALDGAEDVLVIRTDLSDYQHPEWFPEGAGTLDFHAIAGAMPGPEKQKLLFTFLRSLDPARVFNCNSRLFWDMFTRYGKPLSRSSDVYAYMFCSDVNARGHEAGYPVEFFNRCFDDLMGLATDSSALKYTLETRFLVPPDQKAKIAALPTPLASMAPLAAPRAAAQRPAVFWAGRFDRQKRVDIVFELARRMPDVDFRLWGAAVLDAPFDPNEAPSNCRLEGVYRAFSELPMSECDAWLYTAAWDGVPTILLDVATTGVPLVGSVVGGTGEVLRGGLAGRIEDVEDLAAYEAALRAVFADPPAARARAAALREAVIEERSRERYITRLRAFLTETGS